MNVLILNGSPRPSGVVSRAMDAAAAAARAAGAAVVRLDVCRMRFRPCTGCMRCRAAGVCALPEDEAHETARRIREADLLVVGTPTYWGGMSGVLKTLFERMVPVFMGESERGIPKPLLTGRRALVVASCTTPWPFSVLMRQSRGAVRSVREVLGTGGMRVRSVEIAGTRKLEGRLPERSAARIVREVRRALGRCASK